MRGINSVINRLFICSQFVQLAQTTLLFVKKRNFASKIEKTKPFTKKSRENSIVCVTALHF